MCWKKGSPCFPALGSMAFGVLNSGDSPSVLPLKSLDLQVIDWTLDNLLAVLFHLLPFSSGM